MTIRLLRAISPLVKPPLFVIGWMAKTAYRLAFAGVDARAAKRLTRALQEDVADSMPFLFAAYGAVFTAGPPCRRESFFDLAEVLVEFGSVRLWISRCRGSFAVRAAPKCSPEEWLDLALLLEFCRGETLTGSGFRDHWDLATQLRPHVDCLLVWMLPGRFDELKARIRYGASSLDRR